MDERVSGLLTDFPTIFEKVKSLSDLEDDWVIIDVPDNDSRPEDLMGIDDDFLSDLDRYEDELDLIYRNEPAGYDEATAPSDIFPPDIDVDRDGLIEILRRPRPGAIEKLRRKIKGNFPGGPGGLAPTGFPPPDALAVYLPFHRYPDMWGIYLLDAGVASFATDLQRLVLLLGHSITTHEARRVAVTFLFHHEAYHSAVGAFGFKCELPLRKPVYRTGLRKLFTRAWSPGEPHEETLATA